MKFRFNPELVKIDIDATNQKEAIEQLGSLLVEQGYVKEDYPNLVLEREQEYPTGLRTRGVNIAMPHAFDERITSSHVAVGVLKKPVVFNNMEDTERSLSVQLLFMLAIGKAHEQLEMLQILMKIFKEAELLKELLEIKSSDLICKKLNDFIDESNYL